ncbi:hypothetical protein PG997_009879 [Apiospora hydei]|uniref:Uncharacterized protein n=1 Tax=Apiospora hydei TaxID=1337664 RepID=A0ABR1VXY8_9PEZI
MASSKSFPFFSLPGELREVILRYALPVDSGCTIRPYGQHAILEEASSALGDLFVVSYQMYQEASAIFYRQRRFVVDVSSRRAYDEFTAEHELFSLQLQTVRRRIRSLTIILKRIGGDFEQKLAPVISDMILSGELRNLRFQLLSPGMDTVFQSRPLLARRSGVGADLEHTPPFQRLLSLVADPDLEKVEICIAGVHLRFWCAFHEESRQDCPCSEREMRANAQRWLKVDWKRLVTTYGNVQKILRIGER